MPLGLPAPSYMSRGAPDRTGRGNSGPITPTNNYTSGGTGGNTGFRGGGGQPPTGSQSGGRPQINGAQYAPPRDPHSQQSMQTTGPTPGQGSITRWDGTTTSGSMDPYASPENRSMSGFRAETAAIDNWYEQQAYMSQAYNNANMQDAWLRTAENIDYLNMGRDHINATYGNDQAMLAAQREQQVDLVAKQLGVDRTYAEAIWRNMQQDIGNRRGTAAEQLAIQNWLTGQNKKHTGTERDLAFARNRAEFDTRWRNLGYAATAAGSYTSAGHRADRQDAKINAFLGNANANLGYDRSMDSLRAGERTDALGYRSTLDALQNQWNNGYAGYNRDIAGNNISMQGVGNTGRQFDIRGNQLGLDRQNALNQNAWNQSQAAWQGRGTMQQQAQQQAQYLANLAAQAFG